MTINKKDDMTFDTETGIVELHTKFPEHRLFWGEEFHPIPKSARTWGYLAYLGNWAVIFAPIWWGIAASIIVVGLPLWLGLIAILISAVSIYILVVVQSHAGSRYGLAEPQLTRMRWGLLGGWIASFIRMVPALGWYGINSYMFTEMVDGLYLMYTGKIGELSEIASKGPIAMYTLNPALFILVFIIIFISQGLLLYVSKIVASQKEVKYMFYANLIIAPLSAFLLFINALSLINFNFISLFTTTIPVSHPNIPLLFILGISSAFAATITISMSMPDLIRFAKNQKVQIVSQISLIFFFFLMWFFAMSSTIATYISIHTAIYDPYLLAYVLPSPSWFKVILVFLMAYATYEIQLQANLIPPAYDISNFYPGKIKFWMGVIIALIIAAVMQAWGLYLSALSFLEGWMNLYGTFLSPVVAILFFDYLFIRKFKISVKDLYIPHGKFWYFKGFNPAAIIATAITVVIILIPQIPYHEIIYAGASIFGFILGGIIYLILMKWWVIPKYQPFLKGGLIHGYTDEEIEPLFKKEEKLNEDG
ncbi:MAG: cytosine permease [Caldisphaera sp.]